MPTLLTICACSQRNLKCVKMPSTCSMKHTGTAYAKKPTNSQIQDVNCLHGHWPLPIVLRPVTLVFFENDRCEIHIQAFVDFISLELMSFHSSSLTSNVFRILPWNMNSTSPKKKRGAPWRMAIPMLRRVFHQWPPGFQTIASFLLPKVSDKDFTPNCPDQTFYYREGFV